MDSLDMHTYISSYPLPFNNWSVRYLESSSVFSRSLEEQSISLRMFLGIPRYNGNLYSWHSSSYSLSHLSLIYFSCHFSSNSPLRVPTVYNFCMQIKFHYRVSNLSNKGVCYLQEVDVHVHVWLLAALLTGLGMQSNIMWTNIYNLVCIR